MEDTAIDLGSWQITADAAREYLDAVGDDLPVYGDTGIAPPLMLTARVVGLLLDRLSLPDGAIHSLQDVETVGAPRIGMTAATTARVDPPRERGGLRFLTVNYSVTDACSGTELQRGPHHGPAARTRRRTGRRGLRWLTREPLHRSMRRWGMSYRPSVAQSRERASDAYRNASGDHNRIHYDDEFAAATRFGGVIAHGMLTLALVSEMMAKAYGADWLTSGSLRVRFRGAAYPGDTLEATARSAKIRTRQETGATVTCNVEVRNADNGDRIITGTASLLVGTEQQGAAR